MIHPSPMRTPQLLSALLALPILGATASAQEPSPLDIQVYNSHLVTLASPLMDGRLPGTDGMEAAKDYMETWFMEHGLEPAFGEGSSFRQSFPLAGRSKLNSQELKAPGLELSFEAGEDYSALSVGGSGSVQGPAVFVGYSIADGQDGYTNYPEGSDLSGKIAVMFRFEPMKDDGTSRWSERGWSGNASFDGKVRAAREAGAAGVVIINPPGASDPRVKRLTRFGGGGRKVLDGPVFMLTQEAGAALLQAADPQGRSAEQLRAVADAEGGHFDLKAELALSTEIEDNSVNAENVGGLVPGKGKLANEIVVIGAHLDHLGMGDFGSRAAPEEQGTVLHPGADDNASGAAALILLADRLMADYAALPDDADARSILLLAFSAEESGLNGSFYYCENPIAPMEDHALMINFDMIGRITNKKLSVSGGVTGIGMENWAQPFYDASPLDVVTPPSVMGNSDHAGFMRKEVPVLFAILADSQPDYHTPRDTVDKINRIDAVHTVDLFHRLAYSAATRPERFEYQAPPRRRPTAANAPTQPRSRVRVGIDPATAEGEGLGVLVGQVNADTAAEEAGILAGDILVRWDGVKIDTLASWMEMLSKHEPGDEVKVGVKRDGEELTLTVKLRAR